MKITPARLRALGFKTYYQDCHWRKCIGTDIIGKKAYLNLWFFDDGYTWWVGEGGIQFRYLKTMKQLHAILNVLKDQE